MVGTGELSAQNSHTREGFWIGFGFGWASISGGCDDIVSGAGFCDAAGERQGAFAAYLMMGGTLSPHLRLGGEAYNLIGLRDFAGGTLSGEKTLTIGNNLAVALYYYPMVESGLFLKGGVGTAWYVEGEGNVEWSSFGLGFLLGAGYDLRIGGKTSLTPLFTFGWGGGGDLKSAGVPVGENWSHTYFSLALGLTFH
jgi:hypothetical protein